MKQEQLMQMALGVSMVVLAYAIYQHFKGAKPQAAPALTPSQTANPGFAYDPTNANNWAYW